MHPQIERLFSRANAQLNAHVPHRRQHQTLDTSTAQPRTRRRDPPTQLHTLPNRLFLIMAQTLYPRGTLKKIVKAHANRPLSKNVDILVRNLLPLSISYPSFPLSSTSAMSLGSAVG